MTDIIGEYKGFIVCGDTHGNHKFIAHKIKSLKLYNFNLFHVGDFGVGFERIIQNDLSKLKELNDVLVKFNCNLYVIRGNHDDPKFFTGEYDLSNLKMLPDYSVVEVDGEKILMVGGAVSIDRITRKRAAILNSIKGIDHPSYWYDEVFVLDIDKIKDLEGINYIITHSCPRFVFPINSYDNSPRSHSGAVEQYVGEGDTKLKDDLNKERNDLETMYNIISEKNQIKTYFYGHYHKHNSEIYGQTNFICLDIDEFYFKR